MSEEKEISLEQLATEYAERIREGEACLALVNQIKHDLESAHRRADKAWVKVDQAKKRLVQKASR